MATVGEAAALKTAWLAQVPTMASGGDDFRPNRTQEVAGSSPASSIREKYCIADFAKFSVDTRSSNVAWSRFGSIQSRFSAKMRVP